MCFQVGMRLGCTPEEKQKEWSRKEGILQLCWASQATGHGGDCGCLFVAGLLHVAFREVIPQCHRTLCFRKGCVTKLILQLLGLAPLSSSANSGEAQAPLWPQQFPEWDLMMQRGKKAPASSSSADSARSDAPARLAVKVVVMMGRSLRELWHLSKSCWWVQPQHAAILGGIRIYLIYLIFFFWGGARGVGCSVSSESPVSDLIAMGPGMQEENSRQSPETAITKES